MITSTKTDLDSTSFLSSLDMDPQGLGGGNPLSPTVGSRVTLPLGGSSTGTGDGSGFFGGGAGAGGASVSSSSGPATGSSMSGGGGTGVGGDGGFGPGGRGVSGETNVFSDFRRFVSFGLRKDSTAPS
jgi:hypothetical protein